MRIYHNTRQKKRGWLYFQAGFILKHINLISNLYYLLKIRYTVSQNNPIEIPLILPARIILQLSNTLRLQKEKIGSAY